MLIKLEQLEMTADGLRVSVLVPRDQPSGPTVRKVRTIQTSGETIADVIPLRAVGGAR